MTDGNPARGCVIALGFSTGIWAILFGLFIVLKGCV